jgi:hypothetical protein
MVEILEHPGEYQQKLQEVLAIELKTVNQMAAEYLHIYQRMLDFPVAATMSRTASDPDAHQLSRLAIEIESQRSGSSLRPAPNAGL